VTGRPAIQVAYHEAGHAAVASRFGLAVRSLSSIPDGDSRAVVRQYPDQLARSDPEEWRLMWETDSRFRRRFEARVMSLAAGVLAEEKHLGRELAADERAGIGFQDIGRPDGVCVLIPGSDSWKIAALTEKVSRSEDERVAYEAWLAARAASVLADVIIWSQVGAVARALAAERRLTGRRYRELLGAGWDEAAGRFSARLSVTGL